MTEAFLLAGAHPRQHIVIEAVTANGWLTLWEFVGTTTPGVLEVVHSAPDYNGEMTHLPPGTLLRLAATYDAHGVDAQYLVFRDYTLWLGGIDDSVAGLQIKVLSVIVDGRVVVDRRVEIGIYLQGTSPLAMEVAGLLSRRRGQIEYGGLVWQFVNPDDGSPIRIRASLMASVGEIGELDPGIQVHVEEIVVTDATVIPPPIGRYADGVCTGQVYITDQNWVPLALINVHGPDVSTALTFYQLILEGHAPWVASN